MSMEKASTKRRTTTNNKMESMQYNKKVEQSSRPEEQALQDVIVMMRVAKRACLGFLTDEYKFLTEDEKRQSLVHHHRAEPVVVKETVTNPQHGANKKNATRSKDFVESRENLRFYKACRELEAYEDCTLLV